MSTPKDYKFVRIPKKLITAKIRPSALKYYAALDSFCYGQKTQCWPSDASLAKVSGLKGKATRSKAKKELCAINYLSIEYRQNTSNRHTIKRGKYTEVPQDGLKLPPGPFRLLTYFLYRYFDEDEYKFLKTAEITKDLRIKRETLSKYLQILDNSGFIKMEEINPESQISWLFLTKSDHPKNEPPHPKIEPQPSKNCTPTIQKMNPNQTTMNQTLLINLPLPGNGNFFKREKTAQEKEEEKIQFSQPDASPFWQYYNEFTDLLSNNGSIDQVKIEKARKEHGAGTEYFNRHFARRGIGFNKGDGELPAAYKVYSELPAGSDKKAELDAFVEHEAALWNYSETKDPEAVLRQFLVEAIRQWPPYIHYKLLSNEQKQAELDAKKPKQQDTEGKSLLQLWRGE